jgi:hypothetical protein
MPQIDPAILDGLHILQQNIAAGYCSRILQQDIAADIPKTLKS